MNKPFRLWEFRAGSETKVKRWRTWGGQVARLLVSWSRVASLRRRCLDLNFRTQECREGFGQREHLGEAGQVGAWLVEEDEPGDSVEGGPDVGADHDCGKWSCQQTPARIDLPQA